MVMYENLRISDPVLKVRLGEKLSKLFFAFDNVQLTLCEDLVN